MDSTLSFGPIYNVLLENGLPVIGQWKSAQKNDNADVGDKEFLDKSYFVADPGIGYLDELVVRTQGELGATYQETAKFPALLFPDDFGVAYALMLSDRSNSLWPTFSLSPIETEGRSVLYQKNFSLGWLCMTDFGRTMYACTQFLEALIFFPEEFQIASEDIFFNRAYYKDTIEIVETLKRLKRDFMISPERHHVISNARHFGRDILFDKDLKNRDLLFAVKVKNFVFSLSVYEGDPRSLFSRAAGSKRIFHYDPVLDVLSQALPALIPIFERQNQLMSLIYCLNEVIQNDIEINDNIIKTAMKNRYLFEKAQDNLATKRDNYCYRLPI